MKNIEKAPFLLFVKRFTILYRVHSKWAIERNHVNRQGLRMINGCLPNCRENFSMIVLNVIFKINNNQEALLIFFVHE